MSILAKMKLRSIKTAVKKKPNVAVQYEYIQPNQSYGFICHQETTREADEGKKYIALVHKTHESDPSRKYVTFKASCLHSIQTRIHETLH